MEVEDKNYHELETELLQCEANLSMADNPLIRRDLELKINYLKDLIRSFEEY